jgi:hypothetical protein
MSQRKQTKLCLLGPENSYDPGHTFVGRSQDWLG